MSLKIETSPLLLAQLVANGSYPNLSDLAIELDISRRTVIRRIKSLDDNYSLLITYSRSKKGYYVKSWGFIKPQFVKGEKFK